MATLTQADTDQVVRENIALRLAIAAVRTRFPETNDLWGKVIPGDLWDGMNDDRKSNA